MIERRFVTLDVFSATRFAGNPLAVVLECDGLDDTAMQAIAREFNLSETVFVLPPDDPVHLARLRIFMPTRELPFAGHPTIGAAVLLAFERGGRGREELNFMVEEGIGVVQCNARVTGPETGRARFDLRRLPQPLGRLPDASAVAAAIGLDEIDLAMEGHELSAFSAGVDFTFAPVKGLDAARRIRPDIAGLRETGPVFAYTRETVEGGSAFHARMLDADLVEDPATGSAVAAFAGAVMQFERPGDGQHTFVIEQGYAIGRPSRIVLGMDVWKGRLEGASIGGEAIVVSEGRIFT